METEAIQKQNEKIKVKPAKKKKFIFLKILLIIACVIFLFVGCKILCTKWAERDIEKIITVYPFEFQDGDSMDYVTGDFNLPKTIAVDNKSYKVKWKSNNKIAKVRKDGTVNVDTSKIKARNVKLTLIHKRFLGKAEYDFSINVVSDNKHYEVPDVNVITIDSLRDQSYKYPMEAEVTPEGMVRYMYGDFDGVYVYSKADAEVVAEAYKTNLGVDENVNYKYESMSSSSDVISYTMRGYYNDIKLSDSVIILLVDAVNFELMKISNVVDSVMPEFEDTTEDTDCETIIEEYMANILGHEDFIVFDGGKEYYKGTVCNNYIIAVKDDISYKAYVSYSDGAVVYCKQEMDNAEYIDAECKGKDEWGKTLYFTGYKFENTYLLTDSTRRIITYYNRGNWDNYDKHVELLNNMNGYSDMFLFLIEEIKFKGEKDKNVFIVSDTNYFADPVGVEAYTGIQNAWKYYAKKFSHYSYNGNNAPISIYVYKNTGVMQDNAAWINNDKCIIVYPNAKYEKTLACSPDILAHEYTHAVFYNYYTQPSSKDEENEEIAGINEGYADVFSQLIVGADEWKFGKNEIKDAKTNETKIVYYRDIANYNSESAVETCSEKYKDEIWIQSRNENTNKANEHTISTLISHVGYEMHASELFNDNEVADIFYRSLATGGYNKDTTMLDVRRSLIHSADELGYSTLKQDYIAFLFDLERIYDPSYEIETEEYKTETEDTDDDVKNEIIRSIFVSIDGDSLKDSKNESKYIVFYSLPDIIMGDGTLYIWECTDQKRDESESEISERIETQINTKSYILKKVEEANGLINILSSVANYVAEEEGEDTIDINTNTKIKVSYKRINKFEYNIIKSFLTEGEMTIREYMAEASGDENAAVLDMIKKYLYTFYSIETTPYKLYNNL